MAAEYKHGKEQLIASLSLEKAAKQQLKNGEDVT